MATTKGGIIAAKNNKPNGFKNMQQVVLSMKSQIDRALPSVLTGERFSRMILTAMSTTPKLQQCTPKSFLGAMMQAAQLGLEPNTPLGEAYLIPYKNKGQLECQFQIGYKGHISLAHRNGIFVTAHEVYENDQFLFEYGLDSKLIHKPVLTDRGSVKAYYAIWKDKDGNYGFEVMSVGAVQQHAKKYSQSYGSDYSPWQNNFDEMAKKTVLKKALKYAPLTTEFIRAISTDETIKTGIAEDMAELPDETDYTDIEARQVPDNVNPESGEIIKGDGIDHTEDDKILQESLNV